MIVLGPYRLPEATQCLLSMPAMSGARSGFESIKAAPGVSLLTQADMRFAAAPIVVDLVWDEGAGVTEEEMAFIHGLHVSMRPVRFRYSSVFSHEYGILHPLDVQARHWITPHTRIIPPDYVPPASLDWDGWVHFEDNPIVPSVIDAHNGVVTLSPSLHATVNSKVNMGYDFAPTVIVGESSWRPTTRGSDAGFLPRVYWHGQITLFVQETNVPWEGDF